jgi:transcriptional regulator with XRE-family HTH domain
MRSPSNFAVISGIFAGHFVLIIGPLYGTFCFVNDNKLIKMIAIYHFEIVIIFYMGKTAEKLYELPGRIQQLRQKFGLTQSELAKRLGVSRASVNGWEMGASVPSSVLVHGLCDVFSVSSDYILGREEAASVNVSGLSEDEVALIAALVNALKNRDARIRDGADYTVKS